MIRLVAPVADALYWIERYLERAEHVARVIDVRLDLGLDRRAGGGWDFAPLYTSLGLTGPEAPPATPTELVDRAIFDLANRESVVACVIYARENARQVREEISSDMWEHLNGLFLRLKEARAEGTWNTRPHYLSRLIIEGVHLFQGITDSTMGHGEGWQFLRSGGLSGLGNRGCDMFFVSRRRDRRRRPAAVPGPRTQVRCGACCDVPAPIGHCRVCGQSASADQIAEFCCSTPTSASVRPFAWSHRAVALRGPNGSAARVEAAGGPAARPSTRTG